MVTQGNMGKRKKSIINNHFFFLHVPGSLYKTFHLITITVLKDFRYLSKVSKALTRKAVVQTLVCL